MTAKSAKDVLQHPVFDILTKGAIGVLVALVVSGVGDLTEIKQEQAVQGQQMRSLIKTVEDRSDQRGRIVAVEIGKASRAELQALKDTMAKMNVDLRAMIETRIRDIDDRK